MISFPRSCKILQVGTMNIRKRKRIKRDNRKGGRKRRRKREEDAECRRKRLLKETPRTPLAMIAVS